MTNEGATNATMPLEFKHTSTSKINIFLLDLNDLKAKNMFTSYVELVPTILLSRVIQKYVCYILRADYLDEFVV